MSKMGRSVIIAAMSAALLGGCVLASGPVMAPLAVNMSGPVSAGPAATSPKTGRADAWGIVFFATGDASISAAMRNGGITRVHHVDHETLNVFGWFAKYTTIVYGE